MSLQIVESVKARLLASGHDLSGPCGAFNITKHVAWELRATGAGLLSKPAGNNCDGYAVDIIAYSDGRIRDILGDGGGANNPQWPEDGLEVVSADRYRPAIDPGDVSVPLPTPTPTPLPPATSCQFQPCNCKCQYNPDELAGLLSGLIDAVGNLVKALAVIKEKADRPYVARIFGQSVTFTPRG